MELLLALQPAVQHLMLGRLLQAAQGRPAPVARVGHEVAVDCEHIDEELLANHAGRVAHAVPVEDVLDAVQLLARRRIELHSDVTQVRFAV